MLYVDDSSGALGYLDALVYNDYLYGPGVNGNDTSPTTYRVRAESLNTARTTPSKNGQIAWTYG